MNYCCTLIDGVIQKYYGVFEFLICLISVLLIGRKIGFIYLVFICGSFLFCSKIRSGLSGFLGEKCLFVTLIIYFFLVNSSQNLLPFVDDASGLLGLEAGDVLVRSLGTGFFFLRGAYLLVSKKEYGIWSTAYYLFFFPSYFSGPVISPGDFLQQRYCLKVENLRLGFALILIGVLKFLFSYQLLYFLPLGSESHYAQAKESLPWLVIAMSVFGSGFWLYLNFSGFTDVATGMARCLGINLPQNFNNPFAARDLIDFWRRWHITFGTWLRTIVFNPLAVELNRFPYGQGRLWRLSRTLVIWAVPSILTMIVCGIWHRFDLWLIAWGAVHGMGLVAVESWRRVIIPRLSVAIRKSGAYSLVMWGVTQTYVGTAWLLFLNAGQQFLMDTFL